MSALVTAAVVTAGAAAYGAYSSNKAQKEAARQQQAAAEEGGSSTRTPYAPAQSGVDFALEEARRLYDAGLNQQAAKGGRKGKGKGKGGGGGVAGASKELTGLSEEIATRARTPSPTLAAGQSYAQDVLGGGTESDPFARNPIANDLYNRLGDASFDRSQDLLTSFLGGGGGAGFTPSGGSLRDPVASAKNVTPGAEGGAQDWRSRAAARSSELAGGPTVRIVSPSVGGGVTGSGGGGRPVDTMAQGGWFADQVEALFDPARLDPMNDPTMQPFIDALNAQLSEEWENQADRIGDRFAASNMFSGSGRALALGEASGELDEARAATLATSMMGSREAALARQMQALGLVSTRDLAAMGDLTQRYGIDTSAATSRANAGSAASAAAAQQEAELAFRRQALGAETDLATRAQNLQAILGIQGQDQFGLGMLGGLGGQLDANQMGVLGSIPGMEGVDQGWYDMALGGASAVSGQNASASRARADAAARSALAPGADLDDYLRRIMGPATAFGSSSSTGSAPGYSGPSTGESVAGGILGGAAAGLGTYLQYGGRQQPAAQPVNYTPAWIP